MNKTLKELASVEYGKSPNDIRTQDSDIPIYGTGGLLGYAKDYLFKNTMIVVGRKGTLGNPIFAEKGGWVIDTAYAVLPNQDVDPKWLFYNLCNFNLESLNEATGVPSISRDFLYKVSFETPKKIVQNKIARILTTVDTLIEKTEALIRKYESIKQGMMHDLFTRGVDETGRLRPPYEEAPHLYWKSELGWIPKGWNLNKISEVGEVVTGNTPSTKYPSFYDGNIMFVTPFDISEDIFEITTTERTLSEKGFSRTRAIPTDSICTVCIGSTIGKIAITKACCATNQQINSLIVSQSEYVQLVYYLMCSYLLPQLRIETGLQAVPIVNKSRFSRLKIPLPESHFEKQFVTQRLLKMDEFVKTERRNVRKYKKIKKGLMQDLLTGKVRVEVHDESGDKDHV